MMNARFVSAILGLALSSSANAAVVTSTFNGVLDLSILVDAAPDTYGVNSAVAGDSVSLTVSYDNDPSNVTGTCGGCDPSFEASYFYSSAPYGGSASINGSMISSISSRIAVINNYIVNPVDIDPMWFDLGMPFSDIPLDVMFLSIYSDDFSWNNGEYQGLQVRVGLFDFSADIFPDTSIPPSLPLLSSVDMGVITIEQWEQGTKVYSAGGVFLNNLAPVPVPAAAWLFCSGLLGLIGVAHRRNSVESEKC